MEPCGVRTAAGLTRMPGLGGVHYREVSLLPLTPGLYPSFPPKDGPVGIEGHRQGMRIYPSWVNDMLEA